MRNVRLARVIQPPVLELQRVRPPGGARLSVLLGHLTVGGSWFDLPAAERLARTRFKSARVVTAGLGDWGVSVAVAAPQYGLDVTVVDPESASLERKEAVMQAGARWVNAPQGTSLAGLWGLARQHARREKGTQVVFPSSKDARAALSAALQGLDFVPDDFVCGAGSEKTFAAALELWAEQKQQPRAHLLHSEGPHHIQGWTTLEQLSPRVRRRALSIRPVAQANAWLMRERLAREEGLLVSLSSAANVCGAFQVAAVTSPTARVMPLVWGSGEREFSLGRYFR